MRINSNNIYRALRLVWESSRKWSIINFFFVILKGLMPLMLIFVVQWLVDEVAGLYGQGSNGVYSALFRVLFFAGVVFVVNAFCNAVAGIVREKHSFFISDQVQNMIHSRTTSFYFANYEDHKFQDVYYRAVNEASYRPSHTYYSFIGLVQNGISLLLIAGLLASLHWSMIIALLIVAFLIISIRLKYSQRVYRFKREHTEDERCVGYYNRLLTGKEFAKELRVFNLAGIFKARFEQRKDSLRNKRFALSKLKTFYELGVQLLTTCVLLVVFAFVSNEAIQGNITQGQMVMYFLALYRGYNFLQDFLGRISSLYEDGLFLKNFFEFLDYDLIKTKKVGRETLFPEKLRKGIVVKDLSFKYPNSARRVFDKVNFKILPGETVAFVGANGAGKSTLVKLLCGLYQPNEGNVFFDDVDLATIKPESLAENVSVVFQDFMLYNISARENIWLGDVNKDILHVGIEESAKKSGVHNLLNDLPSGYETTLGTLFKDSEMLSVGEWQRLALSRSFFNDAQVVILDEPTSSMDAQTESMLVENFKRITAHTTSIIISHRMSTIKLADRVVVIDGHGIAEEGAPEQLMKQKGVFYRMMEGAHRAGQIGKNDIMG
ncbi:ABC transporter ATP-binding protein [Plebeiibacterium marinum]|uniref:ABC transporter ATP-binding protein/permease n=1 Tax=Plebeiibacterium marinum TaxID=2992111 RepID=A0AAE3MDQ3_9BACT|nr:ABC transporter ATP-binding protein [Plebeiobacterium marinum]MCW3805976.1 ABC transporter ATP-binding protein/permease [Plebeiobacterium marinum]